MFSGGQSLAAVRKRHKPVSVEDRTYLCLIHFLRHSPNI